MTWTTFCNIFLFTSQSWDPKVRRVSLNEWELNRKLAHQNTSRLPNNRKRPCKLWALWQRRERALILTPWLKTFYCALQLTIELASLALKKTDVVSGERAVPVPADSTDNLEGKKKKKHLRYSQIPQTALTAASVHPITERCRNKQARGTEKDVGAIVSCRCLCMSRFKFILFTEGFD